MSFNPFKPWVGLTAVLLWNVPGLGMLLTKGERMAVLVLAGTSLFGAIIGTLIIRIPSLEGMVTARGAALPVARKCLKKISNGLVIIALACGAAYWFLSV